VASVSVNFLRPPPGRRTGRGDTAARIFTQFGETAIDRAARDPGHARHHRNATPAGRARLGRHKTAAAPLVQHWIERLVAQLDGRLVNHATSLVQSSTAPESLPQQNHTAIRLFINGP
jgi:hypothetical protein